MHCCSKVQSTGTSALHDRKEKSIWRGSMREGWRDGSITEYSHGCSGVECSRTEFTGCLGNSEQICIQSRRPETSI